MNVFVLCTGRCGSQSFHRACQEIENYSSGHETRAHMFGDDRLIFPTDHIEIDNRLSWFLGSVDKRYGDDATYIHLIRNSDDVALSYNRRWQNTVATIRAFGYGLILRKTPWSDEDKRGVSEYFVKTMTDNIEAFLKDKSRRMVVRLDNIHDDFPAFWDYIEAEGDLAAALKVFETPCDNKPAKGKDPSRATRRGRALKKIKRIIRSGR